MHFLQTRFLQKNIKNTGFYFSISKNIPKREFYLRYKVEDDPDLEALAEFNASANGGEGSNSSEIPDVSPDSTSGSDTSGVSAPKKRGRPVGSFKSDSKKYGQKPTKVVTAEPNGDDAFNSALLDNPAKKVFLANRSRSNSQKDSTRTQDSQTASPNYVDTTLADGVSSPSSGDKFNFQDSLEDLQKRDSKIQKRRLARKSRIKSRTTQGLLTYNKIVQVGVPSYLRKIISSKIYKFDIINPTDNFELITFFSNLTGSEIVLSLIIAARDQEQLSFVKNVILRQEFFTTLFRNLEAPIVENMN